MSDYVDWLASVTTAIPGDPDVPAVLYLKLTGARAWVAPLGTPLDDLNSPSWVEITSPDAELVAYGDGPLLDPDCRDGKHGSCVGGICECVSGPPGAHCYREKGNDHGTTTEGPDVTARPGGQ